MGAALVLLDSNRTLLVYAGVVQKAVPLVELGKHLAAHLLPYAVIWDARELLENVVFSRKRSQLPISQDQIHIGAALCRRKERRTLTPNLKAQRHPLGDLLNELRHSKHLSPNVSLTRLVLGTVFFSNKS